MKKLSRLSAIFILFATSAAWSQNLDLHTETHSQPNFLAISAENSQFTLPEGTILGSGVKAEFDHSFSSDFGFNLFLSTAFTGQTGGQSSFTGLGGNFSYNLLGECCAAERVVSLAGRPVLLERKELGTIVQLAVGADQYFLNGSKAVYSASGLSIGVNCDFNVWNYRIRASVRQSSLVANQTDMTALFFSLGLMFPL